MRRRLAGFTLVELLIALALIGIITLLLFSALRLGTRSWEAVETVSERVADLRVARQFIERSLRQVRAEETIVIDGVEQPIFAGEPQALEWVAPLSEHVGISGLHILRLNLEQTDAEPRLMLTRWLLHPEILAASDDFPPWEPLRNAGGVGFGTDSLDQDLAAGAQGRTLLLPAAKQFRLGYFGRLQGDDEPDWHEEWLDQIEPPIAVWIDLQTPTQSWPAATIILQTGTITNDF
ncbi:MAG: prepilin-type N-terminal cleavage/methylation domain-containing protein [Chromatiaceae bacterium]|nr:prepilin-type N-terminal cleavage/methylation domain-containing protein [Chromatiaceae bacterium]MCF8002595.1 prepilin-type N-terminal cleavage/methylation domain-containing protein [Chromatiaceae bacterium]